MSNYCIYKGKLGCHILTDKITLTYHNGNWSVLKDAIALSSWVMMDLISAQKIGELELLVLTGVSREELENRIKAAEFVP